MTFMLSSAVCTPCSLFSKQIYSKIFPFLSNNCPKTGNMKTVTEVVNPCIVPKYIESVMKVLLEARGRW